MFWYIIIGLVLLILLFPIILRIRILGMGEEPTELKVLLWKWVVWKTEFGGKEDETTEAKSATEQEKASEQPAPLAPEPVAREPQSAQVAPESTTIPTEAPTPVSTPEPIATSAPTTFTSAPAPKITEEPTEASSDRPLFALALNPKIEMQLLRLAKMLLVQFWRVFKIRIPELRIHYGRNNPAETGWLMGGLWAGQAMFPKFAKYDFVPVWHKPGLDAYQGEVRITITVLRILHFLIRSLWGIARFAWLLWTTYKLYKKDPQQKSLAGWRRWILNKLAPLIPEVARDQA